MLELWEDFRVTPVWGICLGMKHHLKLHSKETWRINGIIAFRERQTCSKRFSNLNLKLHTAALWQIIDTCPFSLPCGVFCGQFWRESADKSYEKPCSYLRSADIECQTGCWEQGARWLSLRTQLARTLNRVTSEIHLTGQGGCCWQKQKDGHHTSSWSQFDKYIYIKKSLFFNPQFS